MLGNERPETAGGDGEGLPDGTGKPKARRGPKPRQLKESASSGMDMAAVFELIGKMRAEDRETMMDFAKELKKPSAKEVREEAENEKKEERIRANRLVQLENAKKQAAAEESRATGCTHASHNPATGITKHAWRAQVHTPSSEKPFFVPTCQLCNYQIKNEKGNPVHFPASVEMLTNGVNLDQYVGLDLDRLKAWFKQSTEQVA